MQGTSEWTKINEIQLYYLLSKYHWLISMCVYDGCYILIRWLLAIINQRQMES